MAEEARETLLVQSKVREAIKSLAKEGQTVRVGDDFLGALNEHVWEIIRKAMSRADKNGRATLRPEDV
jgi:histone H3/H4